MTGSVTPVLPPPREFFSGRCVAVTGASGFLGQHLLSALGDLGTAGIAVSRPGATDVAGARRTITASLTDVDDLEHAFRSSGATVLVHLAAQSQAGIAAADIAPTFETNIAGTWNVLEAARRAGIEAVVTTSSDRVYGPGALGPIGEDAPLRAIRPYDVSKLCGDVVARSFARETALPVAVARCANLFGPGDLHWPRIIPGTCREILAGRPPIIHSDGSARRDYLFVRDAVDALVHLTTAVGTGQPISGKAINVASGQTRSVLEIVELVQHAAGTDLTPVVEGSPSGAVDEHSVSIEGAHELLGWEPSTPIQDALSTTVAWYRDLFSGSQVPAPS